MYKYLLPAVIGIILFSCKPNTPEARQSETNNTPIEESNATRFWNQLKSLQGKTFEGQLQNAPANDDFAGKRLIMHVLYSDDEKILIPFNVGENRSRTWIFTRKNGRIELKHDHRHEDGSNDEVTMYGGTSTNDGKPDMQVFPADEETAAMLPHAFSNVWWVTVDSTTYTYNLRRMGTDRYFSVSFDLTKELEKPEPSWGWEGFN
jgi:hypothetical protein